MVCKTILGQAQQVGKGFGFAARGIVPRGPHSLKFESVTTLRYVRLMCENAAQASSNIGAGVCQQNVRRGGGGVAVSIAQTNFSVSLDQA